jgi:hypothetical protein
LDHPELEFFNSISGELEIELTIPTRPIGNLLNQEADADAEIVSLKLKPHIYVEETEDIRDLTDAELNQIAFRGKQIKLRNPDVDRVITHKAPNGKHFTVRELLAAVEETERQVRSDTEWFDGVDVQHIYFEGISEEDDPGVYEIYWGS